MQKITSVTELNEAIRLLEIKQKVEGQMFKEQLKVAQESLRPSKLISGFFKDITTSPELRSDLSGSLMGLVGGYLSKRAVVGSSHSPFKQFLGGLIQMGVSNLISRNADGIKTKTASFFQNIFGKKDENKN